MTSNSNWWPEVEFSRPDPPRPSPGHWDLVAARSCVVARFRRRWWRTAVLVLDDVSGSSEITVPGRASTCVVTVRRPPAAPKQRRRRGAAAGMGPAGIGPAGMGPAGPLAVFRGRRLSITPGGELRVDGMLTVGDVTDRICWNVTRHILSTAADGTERLVFTAEATLDRRAFGLADAPVGATRWTRVRMRGEFVRARAT